MDALRNWNAAPEGANRRQEAWLLGQSPIEKYLDFTADTAPTGLKPQRAALVDEWRDANDYYHELETSEAGIADTIQVRSLPKRLAALEREVVADPRFAASYDKLPTRFAMVELAKIVVSQPHVDLDHSSRLADRLGPKPGLEKLFRFCHPLAASAADVNVRQMGSRKYLFWSRSADFRFLEGVRIEASRVFDQLVGGSVASAVGLMVGFGSNFLNAIQSDGRIVLRNGHHRAHALLSLGVTHAPCIVQIVTRRDELSLVASGHVAEAPHYYFKATRPPLLKDFFDPRIRKVMSVPAIAQAVEVSFEVREFEIPDFSVANWDVAHALHD